jgi:mannose-1-phosphate guanylyltransferase
MAGGAGERFWPVSRPERPKQFLRLADPSRSLLAEAADRAARLVGPAGTYIATGRHLVAASAAECPAVPPANILAEPERRNTAGCLVWAAAHLVASDPAGWPTTTVAVLTADHRIAPFEQFAATLGRAFDAAEATGGLVTLGIAPTRPETGFGYIESGAERDGFLEVTRFTEKPDAGTAQRFLEHGGYFWNSGMFVWTLPAFLAEMEHAAPRHAEACRTMAARLAEGDEEGAEREFAALPSVSIDYALMEKARRVFVVPASFEWDDLGSWDALGRSLPADADGNVASGAARLVECRDVVAYDHTGTTEICVLGCEGIVVAVSEGRVMVVPKSRAQEVKRFQGG